MLNPFMSDSTSLKQQAITVELFGAYAPAIKQLEHCIFDTDRLNSLILGIR